MASNVDSEGKSQASRRSASEGQCTRCHGSSTGAQNLCSECERSDTQGLGEDREINARTRNVSFPQPDQAMDGLGLLPGELHSQRRRAGPRLSISQPRLYYWISRNYEGRRPVTPHSVYRPISQLAPAQSQSRSAFVLSSRSAAAQRISRSFVRVSRSAFVQYISRSAFVRHASRSLLLEFGVSLRAPVQESGDTDSDIICGSPIKRQE